MAKKLDNTQDTGSNNGIEEVIETSGMDMDDDDTDVLDDELDVDDEGNTVVDEDDVSDDQDDDDAEEEDYSDTDDDDEDETDDKEEDSDDQDDEDETEEEKPVSKKKRKLSPAEVKLIALKKENQKLKKEARERQDKKQSAKLVEQYKAEGFDEETANRYAKQDLQTQKLQNQVELLQFERTNAKVFDQYPEAAEMSEEIMQKAKAANMTAEQVCRALFAPSRPEHETRAAKAAKGESVRPVDRDRANSASKADKASGKSLSASDRAFVRAMQVRINQGKPFSKEEVDIILKRRKV